LPVMGDFLETETDPGLRKEGVALLGQRFTREVVGLLESVAGKDSNEDVRREAEYWLAKIKTRLIPVQLNYYCYEARLTGTSAYGKVPEGKIASFSPPHGRTGSEGRVKNEIGRIFGRQISFTGSKATSMGATDLYEILKTEGITVLTSHRINDFRLALDGGSISKTPETIDGQVFFDAHATAFAVNNQNDALLAARRGDRLALMYLEMAPKDVEAFEKAAEEDSGSGLGSFLESIGNLFKGKSKEPVYYTENRLSRSGLVIYSTLQSMPESVKDVTDYSLAKAEIPGPGGTWILIGHLLMLNKEKIIVGRMAKLVKPDGKVAAEGDEIRVPVKDPAAFTTGGKAAPTPAPAPAAEIPAALESKYLVSFNLDGGGWIHSARKEFRLAEVSGDAVDFEEAKAVLPGPGGNWILTGRLILMKKQGLIMAREAVLMNAEGKIAAEAAILMVPVRNPENFSLVKERHN
ncbi:MAG: HEAT repeat domain-containing protein, partial [Candidatus Aminicenantes bacterium]|nr:HEAT repeat domain-containing protein [Candidatus Aminicenantes bacterium]